jgi:hypothetical protein
MLFRIMRSQTHEYNLVICQTGFRVLECPAHRATSGPEMPSKS